MKTVPKWPDRRMVKRGEADRKQKNRAPGNKRIEGWTTKWLALGIALAFGHASAVTYRGQVLDACTRQPVPYAAIVAQDGTAAYADDKGRFELTLETDTLTVEVFHVGYLTRTATLAKTSRNTTVFLTPEVISLKGVTVTAFRTPVPLGRSGPVAIVERESATRFGNTDLAAALRRTVSAVSRDNVNFSSVTLRGTNAEHVLVAIDGIRLNSAQNGTFDMTTLPVALADRIEVVRGGNSSLYGTSPVGGMINLLTPDPAGLGAWLRAGVGALGERRVEVTHGQRVRHFGYAVGSTWSQTKNGFAYNDDSGGTATMTNADRSSLNAFGKALYSTAAHRASLFAEYASSARGVPGSRRLPSDDARRDDTRGLFIGRYQFQPGEWLRAGITGYRLNQWQNYRDPDSLFPTSDTHCLADMGIHLEAAFYPADWALVMTGFELDDHRLRSTTVGTPGRLDIAGWTQVRFEASRFNATPQARFEALQGAPFSSTLARPATTTVFSPKLTLNWSVLNWLSIFAGLGRSFRAPGLNDLYWPEDAWSYGNKDLRPEFGTGIDLGFSGRPAKGLACRFGGYRTTLTDLIQWQPDTSFRYRPVNVAAATITGIEAEAEFDLGLAGLDANLNWSQAKSDGKRLYYRPDLTMRTVLWARVGLQPLDIRLDLGVEHSSDRLSDPVYPETEPRTLAGFTLLDAAAAVCPRIGLQNTAVRFGVRNILDTHYQTVDFYPNPGRTWFSELELGI